MNNTSGCNLNQLTDQENHILTQLSYYSESFEPGQTIKEWFDKIVNDDTYDKNTINKIKELKKDLDSLHSNVYDLEITDSENNEKTGFGAIAFKDSAGNVGMSFRGTDGITDIQDMSDNLATFLMGTSYQSIEAQRFFDKNKDPNGNNYLYGHSKGGEMATSIFVDNIDDIKACHVLNAQPINPYQLTPKQIKALNSKKYDPVITEYDYVWFLGGCVYLSRIRVMKCIDGDSHGYNGKRYDNGSIINSDCAAPFIVFGAGAGIVLLTFQYLGCYEKLYEIGVVMIMAIWNDSIEEVIDFLDNLVTQLVEKIKMTYEEINILLEKFEALIVTVIDYVNHAFNSGARYAQEHPYINVNTNTLLSYSVRLNKVNKRLMVLDERISGLYFKTGFFDLLNLIQSDLKIGYSTKLNANQNYLKYVADLFDQVDLDIIKKGGY